VAVVDLAGICEVQSGYRGEFFCGGGWAGEDGGAGAGSDVEDLGRLSCGQFGIRGRFEFSGNHLG
jgi:hypothetical protein